MEPFQKKVPVLHHVNVAPGYFKMGVAFPELGRIALPGQFVMVRVPDGRIPLLRRPFSILRQIVKGDEICGFELLYRVVGKGTGALSKLKGGDTLDVLGPLGNGFSCQDGIRSVFLVAGGIGITPLCYLAHFLCRQKKVRSSVFVGGKSASDILCREELNDISAQIRITTEDGSLGEKGIITSLVEKTIHVDGKPDIIYACGPTPMLCTISKIAADHDIGCQVSLETVMACGFGACLGCAVENARSRGRYLHVCTDGPVFDSRAVIIRS
ncbi:MAG: dihydroorotate dehydrogenase electron transfer subunit [Deltaproteobacteria bacterium]|nr:dihydroorotate dehydrogenase electron transfer subunit [Deltaproteobacteria bacterium]